MFSAKSTFAALSVLTHYLATTSAAPTPISFGSIVDGLGNIVDGIGELFDNDFVDSLLSNDQSAVASAAVSSAITSTLDSALFPDLLYFAEFSGAAYCDPKHVVGTEVVCSDNICPTISANTVTTIAEFADSRDTDTTGFVALDDTTRSIVISFRGSQSLRNWLANAQLSLVDVPEFCSGCQVHKGFHEAFLEGFPTILAAFEPLKAANPRYRIVVTGHSLGGGIATLTATELRRQGNVVELFTYGAPRVGNQAISKFITNSGKNFRVTNLDDPVPRLPPVFLGYEHISPEFHISRGDFNINPLDINVLEGGINLGGNTGGSLIPPNILAHLQYLLPVRISNCGSLIDLDIFKNKA